MMLEVVPQCSEVRRKRIKVRREIDAFNICAKQRHVRRSIDIT